MTEKQIVLGYWGFRGRGQLLRHIITYCGLDFSQKLYKSPDQFVKDMAVLQFDFPNLPYLIDGDFKISETLAIARYITRKANKPELLGKTTAHEAQVNNLYFFFLELLGEVMALFSNKKMHDLKTGLFYKTKKQYTKIEKYLQGKAYCIGDYLTITDFLLAEGSYYVEKLYPEEYKQFKQMNRIRQIIENLPEVQAYYKRQGCILTPFLPLTKTTVQLFWRGTESKIPPIFQNVKKPHSKAPAPEKQSASQPSEQSEQKTMQIGNVSAQAPAQEKDVIAADQNEFFEVENPFRVVIISGSLSGSAPINYLLGVLSNLGHPAFQFEWSDISALEMHNEDIDEEGTENVNNLRGQVYQADGVLIGVNETHSGVSTSLINTYNWLVPVLIGKPIAFVSIQCDENKLRKIFIDEGVLYFEPKLSVKSSAEFFDEEGQLSETSGPRVIGFMNTFARFVQQAKQSDSGQ